MSTFRREALLTQSAGLSVPAIQTTKEANNAV